MVALRHCINCVGICTWVITLSKPTASLAYNIRVTGHEFLTVRVIDVVIDSPFQSFIFRNVVLHELIDLVGRPLLSDDFIQYLVCSIG